MADEHVRTLMQARETFVRKRRDMAEQMVPEGAAAAHFAPGFADLQAAIEAIDRAIEDEARLPAGYGARPSPDPGRSDEAAGSNVVDVDFDPA